MIRTWVLTIKDCVFFFLICYDLACLILQSVGFKVDGDVNVILQLLFMCVSTFLLNVCVYVVKRVSTTRYALTHI